MICLGCGGDTEPGDVPSLPLLLHGKFCPVCSARLGYVVPPEIDRAGADDDADEFEDDDAEGDERE